jgi:hypothetical protein
MSDGRPMTLRQSEIFPTARQRARLRKRLADESVEKAGVLACSLCGRVLTLSTLSMIKIWSTEEGGVFRLDNLLAGCLSCAVVIRGHVPPVPPKLPDKGTLVRARPYGLTVSRQMAACDYQDADRDIDVPSFDGLPDEVQGPFDAQYETTDDFPGKWPSCTYLRCILEDVDVDPMTIVLARCITFPGG